MMKHKTDETDGQVAGMVGWQRGDVRTMCGSRTGGWSLPCVMSD
jgi:hypothetical protein